METVQKMSEKAKNHVLNQGHKTEANRFLTFNISLNNCLSSDCKAVY